MGQTKTGSGPDLALKAKVCRPPGETKLKIKRKRNNNPSIDKSWTKSQLWTKQGPHFYSLPAVTRSVYKSKQGFSTSNTGSGGKNAGRGEGGGRREKAKKGRSKLQLLAPLPVLAGMGSASERDGIPRCLQL